MLRIKVMGIVRRKMSPWTRILWKSFMDEDKHEKAYLNMGVWRGRERHLGRKELHLMVVEHYYRFFFLLTEV